jgi:hypothetical protein
VPNPQPRGGWLVAIARDGGQQLGRKFQLYDMTSDKNILPLMRRHSPCEGERGSILHCIKHKQKI